MILNIVILLFILLMIAWWANQGAFSAFLNLLSVVVAGIVAFALWEPVAYLLLGTGTEAASQAWGIGLLAPFVLAFGGMRFALDQTVKKNMNFMPMVNNIVGGAFGAMAAYLSAGIMVIGINFLAIPGDIGGYAPYQVDSDGKVVENSEGGGIWLGCDHFAQSFFDFVSSGSGSPNFIHGGQPIHQRAGDLIKRGSSLRLAGEYDKNIGMVADPNAISIEGVTAFGQNDLTELQTIADPIYSVLGPAIERMTGDQVLYLVTMKVEYSLPTVGSDSTLRIPPTAIQLTTIKNDQTREYAPIAAIRKINRDDPEMFVFDNNQTMYWDSVGESTPSVGAWLFVVPSDEEGLYFTFRQVRMALGEASDAPATETFTKLASATPLGLANLDVDEAVADTINYTKSTSLPVAFSRNDQDAVGFTYIEDKLAACSEKVIGRPKQQAKNNVRDVFVPEHLDGIMIELTPEKAAALLKRTKNVSQAQNPLMIEIGDPESKNPIQVRPFAYALSLSSSTMRVEVLQGQFDTADKLPITQATRKDHVLYIYFRVEKNESINRLKLGDKVVVDFKKQAAEAKESESSNNN